MAIEFGFTNRYFWLDGWIIANIIQLGTETFCDRFVDYKYDPGRRLYDQMTMAARSIPANVAEGLSRHSTSSETEMRLTDVGRASISELMGDYMNYLLRHRHPIWNITDANYKALMSVALDPPQYTDNLLHDVGAHILAQKAKFDTWIEANEPQVAANALMFLCYRLTAILRGMLNKQLTQFKSDGGFTENLTKERVATQAQQAIEEGAPACPNCGKPMIRRTIKRGTNQGSQFWGCSDYPRCTATRRL